MNNFQKYTSFPSIKIWGEHGSNPLLVTIVIPTYKHYKYLEETIRSAIDQDFNQCYEIVIIDDNEKDDKNLEIIKRINDSKVIYYQNTKRLGLFGNWNRCIETARSKYIVFLHDDDKLLPNNLHVLFEIHKQTGDKLNNEKIAVFSNVNFINSQSELIRGILTGAMLRKKKVWHTS